MKNIAKINDKQNQAEEISCSVIEWLNQADLCITGAISNSKDIPVSESVMLDIAQALISRVMDNLIVDEKYYDINYNN